MSAAADAIDAVRLRVAAGADPGTVAALPPRAQRAVAVAGQVGAPLLPALDAAADAEADARRAARAVAVATAQTRVVAGGLVASPFVLVPALGRLFGADLVGFYTQPLGHVVAAAGLALLTLGGLLIRTLVRRVQRPPDGSSGRRRVVVAAVVAVAAAVLVHPVAAAVGLPLLRQRPTAPTVPPGTDEVVDLVAVGLTGGVSVGGALRATAAVVDAHAAACRRLALSLELGGPPPPLPPGLDRLATHLATASDTGAAVAPTLRRLATDLRADDLARVLAAAERLPAQLTFPTALCLLPAVLLLVGAPIVHNGLQAAGT